MNDEISIDLGQFVIINKIGSGSFSEVFKVQDIKSKEFYAAKISLKEINNTDKSTLRNLKREISIISKLNHPSIIKFIGFSPINFHNEEKPIIITEYVEKGSLRDLITLERQSNSPEGWNDTQKLIIIYGIASAMSYLHANKIIHRDLKPANILVDDKLFPKIADFGLSKLSHANDESMSVESTVGIKGTPIYIAPEIWENDEYSPAVDVYAFGIIVYEIITNEEPFKNCKFYQIPAKVTSGKRPEFTFQISETYKKLIERCWSQDPSDRPTFDQIVAELRDNNEFITELVDQNDYLNYVDYIDEYKTTFDATKKAISLDEFIKNKNKLKNENENENEKRNRKSKEAAELLQCALKYMNGEGVAVDKKKGFDFFKKAADKGHFNSYLICAQMLRNGDGVETNLEEAAKYFKLAADNGVEEGMFAYAMMCLKGNEIPTNLEEAAKYMKMSSMKGNAKAAYIYGRMNQEGVGVNANQSEAAKFFQISAKAGDDDAMVAYGKLLEKGETVPLNRKEALILYKTAADKGNIEAMHRYALLISNCTGIRDNKNEAAKYFKMAVDKGDLRSMILYAKMLIEGDGVPKNFTEAAKYVKIVADSGNINSMLVYAELLDTGSGVPVDRHGAAMYYKKAADTGNAKGMFEYGKKLLKGDGVSENKTLGCKYIKLASDKGDQEARDVMKRASKRHNDDDDDDDDGCNIY